MKAWIAVLAVLAGSAAARPPALPKPFEQPPLAIAPRAGTRPVAVIGPSTPARRQPALDAKARGALARRAAAATGHDRLAALDALTAALEQDDPELADVDELFAELAALYTRVLLEPSLATYRHGAELAVRAAKSVVLTDEPLARRGFELVLARFPASPYAYDAHVELGNLAEAANDHAVARRHFQAILARFPGELASYARLRLGWSYHLAGDHRRAVAELMRVLDGHAAPALVEAAADWFVVPYAHAGRADLAAAVFDRLDRSRAAERLRVLAAEYARANKHADAVVVLRAALAREGDRTVACLDRAALVAALTWAPNRADAEVAIAELAAAVPHAEPACAPAADRVVGDLALAWHRRGGDRAQLVRMWTRAAELATTPGRRTVALDNRALLELAPAR